MTAFAPDDRVVVIDNTNAPDSAGIGTGTILGPYTRVYVYEGLSAAKDAHPDAVHEAELELGDEVTTPIIYTAENDKGRSP